jgi:hypothetical protein
MNSPFSLGRFEHDSRYKHAYFLPAKLLEKLASGVPTYLIGGRGTGKTTLLKAFEWRERLHNPFLRQALKDAPFSDGIIGIYAKVSEHNLNTFQNWFSVMAPDQGATIFGLYLDLMWLEDFFIAVSELGKSGELTWEVRSERAFMTALSNNHIGQRLGAKPDVSFLAFSRKIQDMRFAIRQAALVRQPSEEFFKRFLTVNPGEVGQTVAVLFAEHATGSVLGGSSARIRVLLDEADALTEGQHQIVNTVIRLAKSPLSYIFSSIKRFRDVTTTTIPNMSVQRDDCQVVPLEVPRQRAEFKKLAEGVAAVRLQKAGYSLTDPVDLFRWFGTSTINKILHEQLNESLSSDAKRLLAHAEQTGRLPYFGIGGPISPQEPDDDEEFADETAAEPDWDSRWPIYQTHLIKRLKLEVPPAEAPRHVRRQKYAEVRKRMVAAYLDICASLNLRPRYTGAGMVISLADSSIRDFLLQLNELYLEAGGDLDRLTTGKLTIREQDAALRRASGQKISSLPQGVRLPHEKVVKYVDTFGFLTHDLQSGSEDSSHLLSNERGVFQMPKPAPGDGLEEAREVIEECVVTGYFSAAESIDGLSTFRVHKILAPYYGFSYRGAYSAVHLKPEHLRLISKVDPGSEEDRRKLARDLAASIQNQDDVNQLTFL